MRLPACRARSGTDRTLDHALVVRHDLIYKVSMSVSMYWKHHSSGNALVYPDPNGATVAKGRLGTTSGSYGSGGMEHARSVDDIVPNNTTGHATLHGSSASCFSQILSMELNVYWEASSRESS